MEGLLLGSFSILQRTAGGNYTHVRDIPTYPRFDKVFDYDFNALVYPKFIKIVSETEPTYAEVVSDGEITEIKSQTKEVEITANGTTQVAPDAGFSYLTGVSIKTNVPQSGGGGGSESSEEFLLIVPETGDILNGFLLGCGRLARVGKDIVPIGLVNMIGVDISKADAFSIDLRSELAFDNNGSIMRMSIQDYLVMSGFDEASFASIPRLTKEEFYNLES